MVFSSWGLHARSDYVHSLMSHCNTVVHTGKTVHRDLDNDISASNPGWGFKAGALITGKIEEKSVLPRF